MHDVWIGLNDLQWWKNYVWATGERVDYVNWDTGEPSKSEIDENHKEECVQMYKDGDHMGRWNDNNCNNLYPYWCQKDQDPSIAVGQELNANRKCKDGWSQFDLKDGHHDCFLFSTEQKSFDGAEDYCKKQGGNLMSVASRHEQMFLTSLVRSTPVWIGLKKDANTQQWSWTDGWPLWKSYWGPAEPIDDPNRQCTYSKDGAIFSEWVTASCSEQHAFVCKITDRESLFVYSLVDLTRRLRRSNKQHHDRSSF